MPLHPKIVHFPVALLILATLYGILALAVKSKRNLFKELCFWNLLFGAGGALFAVITGLIEESSLVHNEAIHELMETHEFLGFVFTSIFLLVLIWLIVRKAKMELPELRTLVITLVIASGLLIYSAHLGGTMVYREGAGVEPMKTILQEEDDHHHHGSGEANEHEDSDHHDEDHSSTDYD